MISFFSRAENIVEKEEMLFTRIFVFSYNVFKNCPFQGCHKSGLCGRKVTPKVTFTTKVYFFASVDQDQTAVLSSCNLSAILKHFGLEQPYH